MFLFFSKLLPLFVYPLGLACLLIFAALILLWKQPRLAAGLLSLALAALLLGGNGWVAMGLAQSLEWQNIPQDELPEAEAIVVLGGGTKPASPPRPWVDVSEEGDRILYGAKLYKEGKAPLLVLSGGRVDWRGGGPPESDDMAQLAGAMGVPVSAILQDPFSHNTYENAVNVRKILESRGIRRVLLVTSAMHMPRSLLIFKRQGIEAIAAPTDFLVTEQDIQEPRNSLRAVLLHIIPDADHLQRTTRAIKEYIGLFIYRLRGWL